MRAGVYAVVDDREYEALIDARRAAIFLPDSYPRPPGWQVGGGDRWARTVPPETVSAAYRVMTTAMLDDVAVSVDRVRSDAQTADVRARHPEYTGINHQDAPTPHPSLSMVLDPPYGIEWVGTVPWAALDEVEEFVGTIDPQTGESIVDDPPVSSARGPEDL